jgi:hypothetical protein
MTSDYRTAITEALALLENPEQIDQARKVLRDLLERPRQLPQAYIEDLARDDGLNAAFANAADPSAVYFRVDPDTGEAGDQPVRLNHGDDLTDTDGRRLGFL